MERVASLRADQRADLFRESAARLGMTPAVAEKDFWVLWVLARLFAAPDLARCLRFKGGTTLSKAYHLIERFSEDIDLILDWRCVTTEDPRADRSKSQQERLNEEIETKAVDYIRGDLLATVREALAEHCQCAIDARDPHAIQVAYPRSINDPYLRPHVTLEIGPLAAWLPHEERMISAYAAQVFPHLFHRPEIAVPVIRAERTFWEKATILHQEAHRPDDKPQPPRYSRHYYDLARMAQAPVKTAALAQPELLAKVVAFKQRFYPRGWARYDLAVAGSLRLMPQDSARKAVEADYRAMQNMIFGIAPAFDAIMDTLAELEGEINGRG
jgi:hypothetical protein